MKLPRLINVLTSSSALVCVLLLPNASDGSCSSLFVVNLVYVCEKAVAGEPILEAGGVFSCVHDSWGNDYSPGPFAIHINDVIVKAIACDAGTCNNSTCDLISDQRYKRGSCDPENGPAVIMEGPTTACAPLAIYSRELKCQLASASECSSSVIVNLQDVHKAPHHACFSSETCPYELCTRDGISNIGRCPRQDLNITMAVGSEAKQQEVRETWQAGRTPTAAPTGPVGSSSTPTTSPVDAKSSAPSTESSVAATVWTWVGSIVSGILLLAEVVLVWHGWKYRKGYEDRLANAENLAADPNDRPSHTKPAVTTTHALIQFFFVDAFNGARYVYNRKSILHYEAMEDAADDVGNHDDDGDFELVNTENNNPAIEPNALEQAQ